MICLCSIEGCKNKAVRVTMFDAHTPSSVFCNKHFFQMKAFIEGHRDRGWYDNDQPVDVRLYDKPDGKRMVTIVFEDKIFYKDI